MVISRYGYTPLIGTFGGHFLADRGRGGKGKKEKGGGYITRREVIGPENSHMRQICGSSVDLLLELRSGSGPTLKDRLICAVDTATF